MRLVTLIALALATLSAAACNTVEGVGRDVEKLGGKIQGSAK